ncbi:MAG: VWA domain-containing protein [Thermoplasmatota archaeon]
MVRLAALLALALTLSAPVAAATSGLTAGDMDDHLNWTHYLGYTARTLDGSPLLPDLALSDRVTLRIQDAAGHPVPFAQVVVTDGEGASVSLVAGADGIVRLFPGFDGLAAGGLTVRPADDVQASGVAIDLGAEGRIAAATCEARPAPTAIDLMFVVDATGSMSDELQYLTKEISGIVGQVAASYPNADLRFGLTVYRDHGDEYVVKALGFTPSLQTMQDRLAEQRAGGGGDYPEAMEEALAAAVHADWRGGATSRLMFLVADAPPHEHGYGAFIDGVREARGKGIHVEPVGASGVGNEAEYLMRAAAVLTQGRYVFLTDDSGVGNSHAEPHVKCYLVTELSDLLVRIVGSEFTGTRIEAAPGDVIRRVGAYDHGACLAGDDGQEQVVGQEQPVAGTAGTAGGAGGAGSPAESPVARSTDSGDSDLYAVSHDGAADSVRVSWSEASGAATGTGPALPAPATGASTKATPGLEPMWTVAALAVFAAFRSRRAP